MTQPAPFRCSLIGQESLLIQCGDLLRARGHHVAVVATTNESIVRWAVERGISVVGVTSAAELCAGLRAHPCEFLFSIGNLRVLPTAVLDIPTCAAINFHDGPLPVYGGLHAPAWALMDGRDEHGVTWHLMRPAVDAGDVLVQRMFPIAADDTSFTLSLKCHEAGASSFATLVEGLENGSMVPRPHTLDRATYHGRADTPPRRGVLRWSRPAAELHALARALDFGSRRANPLALPKLLLPDGTVVLAPALERVEAVQVPAPGTVLSADADGLRVVVVDGAVRLARLLTVDGVPLPMEELVRRHGLYPGIVLPEPDAELIERVEAANARLCGHERYWVRRLAALEPLALPSPLLHAAEPPVTAPAPREVAMAVASADEAVTLVLAWMHRLTGRARFDVAWRDDVVRSAVAGAEGWFAGMVPLHVDLPAGADLAGAREATRDALAAARAHGSHARSVFAPTPSMPSNVAKSCGCCS